MRNASKNTIKQLMRKAYVEAYEDPTAYANTKDCIDWNLEIGSHVFYMSKHKLKSFCDDGMPIRGFRNYLTPQQRKRAAWLVPLVYMRKLNGLTEEIYLKEILN